MEENGLILGSYLPKCEEPCVAVMSEVCSHIASVCKHTREAVSVRRAHCSGTPSMWTCLGGRWKPEGLQRRQLVRFWKYWPKKVNRGPFL